MTFTREDGQIGRDVSEQIGRGDPVRRRTDRIGSRSLDATRRSVQKPRLQSSRRRLHRKRTPSKVPHHAIHRRLFRLGSLGITVSVHVSIRLVDHYISHVFDSHMGFVFSECLHLHCVDDDRTVRGRRMRGGDYHVDQQIPNATHLARTIT